MPAHIVYSPAGTDDRHALADAVNDLERNGERYVAHQWFEESPASYFVIITENRGKVERRTRPDAR